MVESLTRGAYKIDADAIGWEWRDESASAQQVGLLRSLVEATEVRLRYQGDPYAVETGLGPEERRSVSEVLELYDPLRLEGAPLPPRAVAA